MAHEGFNNQKNKEYNKQQMNRVNVMQECTNRNLYTNLRQ